MSEPAEVLTPAEVEALIAEALVPVGAMLAALAERIRNTAADLHAGVINPHHAANRLLKIAAEISAPKKEAKP